MYAAAYTCRCGSGEIRSFANATLQIIVSTFVYFKARQRILYLKTLFIFYIPQLFLHNTSSFAPFASPVLFAQRLGLFSARNMIHPTHSFFFFADVRTLKLFRVAFSVFTRPTKYRMAAVFRIVVATVLLNACLFSWYTCAKIARDTVTNACNTKLSLYFEWT